MDLNFTVQDLEQELCERSLRHFVEMAWKTIEPHPFVPGWHIDEICNHLERVSRKEIRNLIINVPPRHTKSLVTNVFWPAWEWGPNNNPSARFLSGSYAASLSIRDAVKCRRVIQSRWYQELWRDRFRLMGDQNAKQRYDTSKGGYRISTSVDGAATGEGGDFIIADDPNNVNDIWSESAVETTNSWWDNSISTRGDSPKAMSKVVIQQRLPNDLTGHILETNPDDYARLVLPARYEGPDKEMSTSGFKDPRTVEGELLWPAQFNEEDIVSLERQLGDLAYAQLQQRPAPLGGTIFKREWWKYYEQELPRSEFDTIFQSWDMAFKDTKASSFVAGQVWGIKGSNRFLLGRTRKRLSFTGTLEEVLSMRRDWPETQATYIEDKANGPAIISVLKDKIPGLIPVTPEGSKTARAFAVSPDVQAGNVWLPAPRLCPWVIEFLNEVSAFPNSRYNDETDTMTQALNESRKWIAQRGKYLDLPPIVSETRTSPLAGLR